MNYKALDGCYQSSLSPYSTLPEGNGLKFDMKCHILHDFRTSTSFKEKLSDDFKDLHKLKLPTNVDVNLT